MCAQWRDEIWLKKRKNGFDNGATCGGLAKGTYKGGNISQLAHLIALESESEGTPINWLDVYVATRDGLPDAVNTLNNYHRFLDEWYPERTQRLYIDQELWEKASIAKKNYVKGQG